MFQFTGFYLKSNGLIHPSFQGRMLGFLLSSLCHRDTWGDRGRGVGILNAHNKDLTRYSPLPALPPTPL